MADVLPCECGMFIAGRTMNHAIGNLVRHKKTEQHKKQMKFKKEAEGEAKK